jgi:hypothetical protein
MSSADETGYLRAEGWLPPPVLRAEAYVVPANCEHHFLHTKSEWALGVPEARQQLEAWLAVNGRA